MAKYMLLIYGDEKQWDAATPEQASATMAAHAAFQAAAGSAILAGEELHRAPMATTLRSDSAGGVITTDGPFLETKEARRRLLPAGGRRPRRGRSSWRRCCPRSPAGHSGVEIRPVVDHG